MLKTRVLTLCKIFESSVIYNGKRLGEEETVGSVCEEDLLEIEMYDAKRESLSQKYWGLILISADAFPLSTFF